MFRYRHPLSWHAGHLRCAERDDSTRMQAMTHEPFRVIPSAGSHSGQQLLSLKGALTSTSSPVFIEALHQIDSPVLIIDMTDVPSMDSLAIGALVRAFVSCHKAGRKLGLVGLNHRVHNVLQLTGVAPLFETFSTVAEAETALA
jgi:anti-anti-sigma factor